MGDLEGFAKALLPVVAGVLVAGLLLNQLGASFPLLTNAQKGFTG